MISLIKSVIFAVFLYSGYVPLRDFILGLLGRSRAVVVYYHRIGAPDLLAKPASEFRRDLEYLKRHYECIGLFELCERLRAKRPLKRGVVVITFDDGYEDNFMEAVPALAAQGLTATFFVATGFIGTEHEFAHDLAAASGSRAITPVGANPKLTWDDLRAMQSAGFEIGSHTVKHVNLARADATTLHREVNESLEALNRELGIRPRAFSFPQGKPADISVDAVDAVRRAGYYAALSAYGGANSRGSRLFDIRRIDVGNGHMSRLAVRARIAGLDPDYFRWKRKQRRAQAAVQALSLRTR